MQYFKPTGRFFVGDCMPFYHDGTFHVFWLLDEDHHKGRGGLGGHQWAHCSTRDLVHWEHHDLAVPLDQDWEGSICTGSVFFHDGVYHAFYPTRKPDRAEVMSHAVSNDGIAFRKLSPNPFVTAPAGFTPNNFRDPFVFADDAGRFHMLVTSMFAEYPLKDWGGCLLRYSSGDLVHWQLEGPFLVPGAEARYAGIPECPDLFAWNGRCYLLFGSNLMARYRMAASPMGPWIRPPVESFDGSFAAVMKTAPFGADRRLGVAFLCSRKDNHDQGERQWAGNMIFRELVQLDDGTLGTRFVKEMIPATGDRLSPAFEALTGGVRGTSQAIRLDATQGFEVAAFDDLPVNFRLRCTARPGPNTAAYGLGLRGAGRYETRYDLRMDWHHRTISLAGESVPTTIDLREPCQIDIIATGDIIDVCVNSRQCIINRCPQLAGQRLFFFCQHGTVQFGEINVRPVG